MQRASRSRGMEGKTKAWHPCPTDNGVRGRENQSIRYCGALDAQEMKQRRIARQGAGIDCDAAMGAGMPMPLGDRFADRRDAGLVATLFDASG